jgi:hypothetical protein
MKYKMPFKVQPYNCYIHEEFRNVRVKEGLGREGKFDRLFDFFSFIKVDKTNMDLVQCYHGVLESQKTFPLRKNITMNMKKKPKHEEAEKNPNYSSDSNSQTKKSTSKQFKKKNGTNNIYLKKEKTQKKNENNSLYRSTSPKTLAVKKYSINMKTVKSGEDLFKGMINSKY